MSEPQPPASQYHYMLEYLNMRKPDAVLELVLFGAWTLYCCRTINAFTLLGAEVMRNAADRRPNRKQTPPSADPGQSLDSA